MVDEAHGDSKATVNTAKAQTILQQYQQARQTDKPSQPQQTLAYSGVKGYDPSQPANSAYNRTILSYNSAGVNYDVISGGKDTAPTTSQAASVFGTAKPDTQLQQAQAKGYQDVQVFDKSGTVIATVPIGSANDKLNTLANQYGEISYKPVNQKSVNPEEEQMVLQSLKENPQMLGKVITAKGSYLNSLVAQGVLTSEDIDKINQISGTYTAQVKAANAKTRQENIQASFKEQADITTNLQSAQKAGVTSVNIVDASGKVVGTVNPQNIGQARLQTLKLVSRSGGVGLQYNITTNTQAPGVETKVTTYQPSNPLTAFTGGALGGFAELGLIGVGLVAKLTGRDITIPGTNYTAKPTGVLQQAQEKVQKTFGQETIDKIISGGEIDFNNPIELASLAGLGTSIVATGGVGGVKAVVKAPSLIADMLRASGVAKTIFTKEFQEGAALSQLQKVKGTSTLFEMEQATIQKSKVVPTTLEDLIRVERLPSGKVQAVKVSAPNEVKIPVSETQKPVEIPYGVVQATGKGVTSLVTKVTNLTPQEIAIKGLPLEVGAKMGLERLPNTGGFPIFKGKLTAKNIPILMEEIYAGRIKPSFDILQYATRDISKGGGRYGLLSRNPEILSSNAFERVTRPSIIRYFEAQVELEKEVKPVSRLSKGMKPLGQIRESKGGAGATGKAQSLTREDKQLVQTITRADLQKQSPRLREDAFGTVTRVGTRTGLTDRIRQEEETVYLTTPKGATRIIPISKTKTIQKQDYTNEVARLTQKPVQKTVKKQTSTGLLTKTIPTSLTKPVSVTTTKTKQITKPIQSQKQELKTGTPLLGKPQVPENKRFGGLLPGLGTTPGALGRVSKSGSRKVYRGNVPLENIVGMYNRSEISYGNVKNPKPKKLSSNGKNLKFR